MPVRTLVRMAHVFAAQSHLFIFLPSIFLTSICLTVS